MDKFVTKTQMQTILDNRPKGVSMDDVINGYRNNGYKVEGIDPAPEPTLGQKLTTTGQETLGNIQETKKRIQSGETNLGVGLVQQAGNIGEGLLKGAGDIITSTPVVKDVVSTVAQPISEGVKATQDWLANNQQFQKIVTTEQADKIASILDAHPDIGRTAEAVNNIANAVLLVKGGAQTAGKLKNLAVKATEKAPEIVAPVVDTTKAIAEKITPTSESIMQRVARIPKGEQSKFEALTGESVGSYLDKRGIYGTPDKIVEQLYNRFQTSKATADEALATLQGTYRATPVRTALTELEGKVQRTSSAGAPDPDLSRVIELVNKERKIGLTMSEINEVKRIYERRVRLDYLKTNVPEDVARATNVDTALRNWQMTEAEKSGLKNLGEINKETQATKKLMDALGKENAGIGGNNALGLTDAILIAGGSSESIASLLVKKTLSDKGLQSFVAKNISKNKEKIGVPQAQFKEKLQLPPPKEGQPKVSNDVPIKVGKSQSKADANLQSMNAKKGSQQSQGKVKIVSPPNPTTPKKKVNSVPVDKLEQEAKKYKSAEEFVKAQEPNLVYHGSTVPLKSFNNKSGTFFTDDMMNADGYGNGENVYEGVLNLKKPLIIDAKGKRYDNLNTPYGKSTREIVGNVDSKKYDGVIFKNIKDSFSDGEEAEQVAGTISYAFKPKDAFLNESQLTDLWKKANKK